MLYYSIVNCFHLYKLTHLAASEIWRIFSRWFECFLLTASQLNWCWIKLNQVHSYIPHVTLLACVQEPYNHARTAATKANWCKHLFSQSQSPAQEKAHLHSCLPFVLSGQVTHVACLRCSGSMCPTACSNSCQYHAASQSGLQGREHRAAISDELFNSKSIYCNSSGPCLSNNHLVASVYYILHQRFRSI